MNDLIEEIEELRRLKAEFRDARHAKMLAMIALRDAKEKVKDAKAWLEAQIQEVERISDLLEDKPDTQQTLPFQAAAPNGQDTIVTAVKQAFEALEQPGNGDQQVKVAVQIVDRACDQVVAEGKRRRGRKKQDPQTNGQPVDHEQANRAAVIADANADLQARGGGKPKDEEEEPKRSRNGKRDHTRPGPLNQDDALIHATALPEVRDPLSMLVGEGATDDQIFRELIKWPSVYVAGSATGNAWSVRGGSIPAFWYDTDALEQQDRARKLKPGVKPTLEGVDLVKAVRRLLHIRKPRPTKADHQPVRKAQGATV
jgi:hypothetical protein